MTDRMSEGLDGSSRRERMRQERGRGWETGDEERVRQAGSQAGGKWVRCGGGLVNVSGVSPGPERRVSDRRTMAAGSIQKHSCCECTPGSVFCSAMNRHL